MSQAGSLSEASDPSVATQYTTDSGIAVPALNNLNIFGGAAVTVSGSGDTIVITSTSGSFTWNTVTSATNPNSLIAENGYIATGSSPVIFVLPAAASVGDIFFIVGYSNLWQLTQNAGQTIYFGSRITTTGVNGSMAATMIKDTIEILCVTANAEFQIINSIGNITVI